MYHIPVKIFLGKHCKYMASYIKVLETLQGHIFNLKVRIKNPALSSFPPHVTLHACIKIIPLGVTQSSNNILFCFFFST